MDVKLDQTSESSRYKYWAFISYSSKDRPFAKWLHTRLETYQLPVHLVDHLTPVGDPAPKRLKPLFWDRAEMTAHHDLGEMIEEGLRASRYLIVVCSPHSAASPWVNKEVETFQKIHGHERVLAVIISGDPGAKDQRNPFPPALRGREPKAPDCRPDGDGKRNAVLMLLATMLGIDFDVLKRRDQERRIRLLGLGLALALVLMAAMGWLAWVASVAREQAEVTMKAQEKLLWDASVADHHAADAAFDSGRAAEGLCLLERSLRYRPMNSDALQASVNHTVGPNAEAWRVRDVFMLPSAGGGLDFSPDGNWLIVNGRDKTCRVVETLTGKSVSTTATERSPVSVACHPKLNEYVAGTADGRIFFVDAKTGVVRRTVQLPAKVGALDFSPDGSLIAVGAADGRRRVVEFATGKVVSVSDLVTEGDVYSVSFYPDGKTYAASGDSRTVALIDALSGKVMKSIEADYTVVPVRFCPDGVHLVVGRLDGKATLMNVVKEEAEPRSFDAGDSVWCLDVSADGQFLAVGTFKGAMQVFNIVEDKGVKPVSSKQMIGGVAFSADGRYLAASALDGSVRVVEPSPGKEFLESDVVSELQIVSPDASTCMRRDVRRVDVFATKTGELLAALDVGSWATVLACTEDGKLLAVGCDTGEVKFYELPSGKPTGMVRLPSEVNSLVFSADGQRIAGGCRDSQVSVWAVATMTEEMRWHSKGETSFLRFTGDGTRLVAGLSDDTIHCLRVPEGTEVRKVSGTTSASQNLLSGDGLRLIVLQDKEKTMQVQDTQTGKVLYSYKVRGTLDACTLNRDGSRLALVDGSADEALTVLEIPSGATLLTMSGMQNATTIRFSDDDRWLAIGKDRGDNESRKVELVESATGKICMTIPECGSDPVATFHAADRVIQIRSNDGVCFRLLDNAWSGISETATVEWTGTMLSHSGRKLDSQGRMVSLDKEDLKALTQQASSSPPDENTDQSKILRWSRTSPDERTVTPWSDVLVRRAVGDSIIRGTAIRDGMMRQVRQTPWHPLAPAALSLILDHKNDESTNETPVAELQRLFDLSLDRLEQAPLDKYDEQMKLSYAAWLTEPMQLVDVTDAQRVRVMKLLQSAGGAILERRPDLAVNMVEPVWGVLSRGAEKNHTDLERAAGAVLDALLDHGSPAVLRKLARQIPESAADTSVRPSVRDDMVTRIRERLPDDTTVMLMTLRHLPVDAPLWVPTAKKLFRLPSVTSAQVTEAAMIWLEKAGLARDAVDETRLALARFSGDGNAAAFAGWLSLALGENQRAVTEFERATVMASMAGHMTHDERFGWATALLANGDPRNAFEVFFGGQYQHEIFDLVYGGGYKKAPGYDDELEVPLAEGNVSPKWMEPLRPLLYRTRMMVHQSGL